MSDDQKFNVPEPPVGIGTGFLTEYWQQQEPLPTIQGVKLVWYFLQRGFQTITALPMSNAITIMTIAVSLFILSGFLLLLQNVGKVIVSAGSTFYVTAYVKDTAPEQVLSDYIRELEANPRIRSVEFISKEKALVNFKKDLGDRSSFLDGIDQENPLPASLDIVLQPDELGIHAIEKMIETLRANTELIEEVVYGNEWVERVQGILRIFRIFGGIALLVVLVIVVSLIGNTIKLVFYSRRDEISIMQLVGASEWFVKTPFVIGGLLQGLVGSLLGIFLLWGAYALLNLQLQNAALLGVALPELSFLSLPGAMVVVFLGLFIGAVGSFFSLGRFMNV